MIPIENKNIENYLKKNILTEDDILPGEDGNYIKAEIEELGEHFKNASNSIKERDRKEPTFEEMFQEMLDETEVGAEAYRPHLKSMGLAYEMAGLGESNWKKVYDKYYQDVKNAFDNYNKSALGEVLESKQFTPEEAEKFEEETQKKDTFEKSQKNVSPSKLDLNDKITSPNKFSQLGVNIFSYTSLCLLFLGFFYFAMPIIYKDFVSGKAIRDFMKFINEVYEALVMFGIAAIVIAFFNTGIVSDKLKEIIFLTLASIFTSLLLIMFLASICSIFSNQLSEYIENNSMIYSLIGTMFILILFYSSKKSN